jgi:hypothetical protein
MDMDIPNYEKGLEERNEQTNKQTTEVSTVLIYHTT